MTRPAAALAATVAILLGASGCQTTQELSAKIARKLGHQSAIATTTGLGAVNRSVRVRASVLISGGGQSAVAVELTNTGARAQTNFPVLIDVLDAKNRSVYRNDTKGIEPSLQQLAVLPAHATAWWVDNEVLAPATAALKVSTAVGESTTPPPASVPAIAATAVSASSSFPGPHVSLTVINRSSIAQTQLPVYAVALRGGRVVGAGRAIVPALAAGAHTSLEIPITGTVDESTISLTIAPSAAH
jgi:hypothetical protein